jgi:uncharacterized protein (DUF1697 family)
VGGKNKVEMAKLRQTFESLGFLDAQTFIASGNVIFRTDEADHTLLVRKTESAIEADFGLSARVLLRDLISMGDLVKRIPDIWKNDNDMRCDVMFLFPDVDSEKVLQHLTYDPTLEDVRYVPGAVLWRIDRNKATKSRMVKIVGTPLYQQITIRNVNTVRRLYELALECHARAEKPQNDR